MFGNCCRYAESVSLANPSNAAPRPGVGVATSGPVKRSERVVRAVTPTGTSAMYNSNRNPPETHGKPKDTPGTRTGIVATTAPAPKSATSICGLAPMPSWISD